LDTTTQLPVYSEVLLSQVIWEFSTIFNPKNISRSKVVQKIQMGEHSGEPNGPINIGNPAGPAFERLEATSPSGQSHVQEIQNLASAAQKGYHCQSHVHVIPNGTIPG
jgi:hypothetical protein